MLENSRAAWLAKHVLPHEPVLRAWLYRRRFLPVEPDDLIQESYAILAELATVDHIVNPRNYLFQTVKSLILRELRRARIVSIQAVEDLEALGAAADEPSPERQASDRQELERLLSAVDALPWRCREVFKLRRIEDTSQREIAARLGLSEKTVEKHMARALRLLMDVLGGGGETGSRASTSIGTKSNSDYAKRRKRDQSTHR